MSRPHHRSARACLAAAAALAALYTPAQAAEDGPQWHFGGFGTIGTAHSTEKQADYTASMDQSSGAGHTHRWDFGLDSKLGAQIDGQFGSSFSATAQLLTRRRFDGSFKPELMLGFVKWQATPSVALRGGRMPYPAFLISDYREVGYSQPTVRPPVDMYQAFFTHSYDGADVTWKTSLGSAALKTNAFYGVDKPDLPGGIVADFPQVFGLNVTADLGDVTYRASYIDFKLTPRSPQLDAVFAGVRYGFPANALGAGSPALPGAPDIADAYYREKQHTFYASLGASYDPGDWFVTAEAAVAEQISFFPRRVFGHVTGGFRMNEFTPYGTVSIMDPKQFSMTGHPVVDQMLSGSQATGQKTLAVGLRWDVVKNVALKTQYDHVMLDNGSHGQLANVQPGFQPGGNVNVLSFSVDFVF